MQSFGTYSKDGETRIPESKDLVNWLIADGWKKVPDGGEPPLAGAGSSTAAWKAYAEALGHAVPEDATRDDIVALVRGGSPASGDANTTGADEQPPPDPQMDQN